MDMIESVKKVVQELILPELGIIKAENQEIKTILQFINQRVNDTNIQLVDQSRRIDELRVELKREISELRVELKKDMFELRMELKEEIAKNTTRIDGINSRLDETNNRIDETNNRMNRLYEVIVRRDEHEMLGMKVARVEKKVTEIEMEIHKIAA
ncbi:MAG: hypothetical protein ABH886_10905 [Candidatus Desantisbacteria bacterium]